MSALLAGSWVLLLLPWVGSLSPVSSAALGVVKSSRAAAEPWRTQQLPDARASPAEADPAPAQI